MYIYTISKVFNSYICKIKTGIAKTPSHLNYVSIILFILIKIAHDLILRNQIWISKDSYIFFKSFQYFYATVYPLYIK